MAFFERQASNKLLLDDTEPLKCTIENWKNNNGHTEFIIKVHRGPFSDQTWRIYKRYNDFYKLHNDLRSSGIDLDLPPKKLIGNMEPHFINERQQGLQKYLDSIFMNPILVSSLPARSFVDPANYCQPFGELALQHVSLALRGEVGWEVVGPIADIGWRLRKHYYQLKCKSMPKREFLGSWADYGPDRYLEDRDMQAVFRSLGQMQHPYLHSIDLCLCTDVGGLVVRSSHKNGTLRDMLCGAKPQQTFLKKYGNPKGHKPLTIDQISLYGRQILEALKFLHDKGFPYGHLHTGNVLIENDRVKLLDIENGVLGVPSFYRPYFMQHKKINSMLAIDVYCFGHVLYEMMFGTPLHESTADIQNCCVKNILDKILSTEACKNGLPTVMELLSDPFFCYVQLNLLPTDRAHFKIPSSTKEQLKNAIAKMENRLKDEQKMVRSQKRLVRVQEMMSCEEEKKKHRHNKMERMAKEQQKQNRKLEKANSLNGNRSDSVNSSTATSIGTSTPPSMTGSSEPNPPPPPPLPSVDIPPPPPPPAAPMLNGAAILPAESSKDRSQLLGAICNFNKSSLRKTKVS